MEVILTLIVTIVTIFLSPFISFFIGWISGWLIKITIGNTISVGLSLVGLYIDPKDFPLFFGTLYIIAGFFHSHSSNYYSKYNETLNKGRLK